MTQQMITIDPSEKRPSSPIPVNNLIDLANLCAYAPPGDIVEVGVWNGGSAWFLNKVAKALKRKLHLFDTFTGIPEQSPGDLFEVGHFGDTTTSLEAVKEAFPMAVFHVGVFPGTLPDDVNNLSFVHIDCDQALTCRVAIELLWPRVVPGGVMAFDDYRFPNLKKEIDGYFGDRLQFTKEQIAFAEKDK